MPPISTQTRLTPPEINEGKIILVRGFLHMNDCHIYIYIQFLYIHEKYNNSNYNIT